MAKKPKVRIASYRRWWEDVDPIHECEGDGQQINRTYARLVNNGQWEYAIVTLSDDGEFQGAMILCTGTKMFIGESALR